MAIPNFNLWNGCWWSDLILIYSMANRRGNNIPWSSDERQKSKSARGKKREKCWNLCRCQNGIFTTAIYNNQANVSLIIKNTSKTFYYALHPNFCNRLLWIRNKIHVSVNNLNHWIIFVVNKTISRHKRCPADYGRYGSRKLLNVTACNV